MSYRINIIKSQTSPHKHKNYEIIIYVKGNGILNIAGKDVEVFPGKIAIIPPETLHSTVFAKELNRIYINGEFNHIFNFTSPVVISDTKENEGNLLAKIIYDNRFANPEYIAALINAFAHFLLKSFKAEDEINIKIKEIINDITTHFYDSSLNLNHLLEKSGYAPDYIRAHFKNLTGKTPIAFLTEVRINHACYLIDIYKKSMTLSEIAEKCGYTDYIYFSRRFKHVTGMSPRAYMEI